MFSGLHGDFEWDIDSGELQVSSRRRGIRLIKSPDVDAVRSLLASVSLPTDDLPSVLEHFIACGDAGSPDGVVGLELFGRDGLLRSLAVSPASQGRGVGGILVAAAEHHARSHSVRYLYLLTETAEPFFAARGYRTADRGSAPASIRATREFSELCPDSASLMVKELVPDGG